jgi:hypothetical protein
MTRKYNMKYKFGTRVLYTDKLCKWVNSEESDGNILLEGIILSTSGLCVGDYIVHCVRVLNPNLDKEDLLDIEEVLDSGLQGTSIFLLHLDI